MKYKINELVNIIKTKESKRIIDSEIISSIEIYYMDDDSSYSKNQIINENYILIDDFLVKNEKKISIILNNTIKTISNGFSNFWLENKHILNQVN
jgi:hypothetical protein